MSLLQIRKQSQRQQGTCPRSPGQEVVGLGFESRQSGPRVLLRCFPSLCPATVTKPMSLWIEIYMKTWLLYIGSSFPIWVELICLELKLYPMNGSGPWACLSAFSSGIFFYIEPASSSFRISSMHSEAKLILTNHCFGIPFTPWKLKSWKMFTECENKSEKNCKNKSD